MATLEALSSTASENPKDADPDSSKCTPLPTPPPPTYEERMREVLFHLQTRTANDSLPYLESLIKSGWNPNTDLYRGSPLLHLVTNYPSMILTLLEAGADPNLGHQTYPYKSLSRTPLIRAIRKNHRFECIQMLVYHGAMNELALYAALYMKEPKYGEKSYGVGVLRLLLRNGAKRFVNVRQKLVWYDIPEYDSVLQAALFVGGKHMVEKVELLVEAGASVDVPAFGEEGVGLLDWAREKFGEDSEVYSILMGGKRFEDGRDGKDRVGRGGDERGE